MSNITAKQVLELKKDIKSRYIGEFIKNNYTIRYDRRHIEVVVTNDNCTPTTLIYYKYNNIELKVLGHEALWLPTLNKIVEIFERAVDSVSYTELEVLFA